MPLLLPAQDLNIGKASKKVALRCFEQNLRQRHAWNPAPFQAPGSKECPGPAKPMPRLSGADASRDQLASWQSLRTAPSKPPKALKTWSKAKKIEFVWLRRPPLPASAMHRRKFVDMLPEPPRATPLRLRRPHQVVTPVRRLFWQSNAHYVGHFALYFDGYPTFRR